MATCKYIWIAPMICLLLLIILSTSAAGKSNSAQTEMGRNITQILNAFFSSGYDKRVRPNYAGPPVEVGVTMYIISISSVSEVQMDFTCDFYFRQGWRDPRLSFKPRGGIEALFVGAEVAKQIWVPDTFFANEKSAQFHTATTDNTFIRIKANGDVFRSTRLTVTSSCPMNLQYFPMDRQECTIEVESYGYSMADIMYRWGIDNPVGAASISENVSLPQFKVQDLKQDQKVEVLSTGNYSRLVCHLEFVRSMGYYLIQIYIPASLIVIISWVSFWLHRNASPARVQLGVTTVLTMTTLMSSTNAALPKISYIKSIDVYLGTCFVMVFASLLEYATVGYMGKRIAMRTPKTSPGGGGPGAQGQTRRATREQQVELGLGNRMPPHVHHQQQQQMEPLLGAGSMRTGLAANYAPEVRYRVVSTGPPGPDGRSRGPSIEYSTFRRKFSRTESETAEGSGGGSSGREATDRTEAMPKGATTLFGVCPSDIDKYSRVVFPVCFLCFNLMYWIVYAHISEFFTGELEEGE